MSEFVTDQGKVILPGYTNAFPPGTGLPTFALTAGDAGLATEIGQAGGTVLVDTFGGVNMTASSGAFMGIDSFANISLNTSTLGTATVDVIGASTITLSSAGGEIVLDTVDNGSYISVGLNTEVGTRGLTLGGGVVNITNAGTIAFDTAGSGAMTGVQTINGAVYPPPGGGGSSITQAGALVACLGSGAVTISSIGVGADVEVYNAGTIRFDAMGAGAITGLSTINGTAYPPSPGSISSISNGLGYVEVDSNGTVALQATGSSFLTLDGSLAVVPNKVTLTAGSGLPEIVLSASGSNDISINNPGSTVPSFLTMAIDGSIEISGAAVNITNLSTVNGSAYPPSFVIPSDVTVSTLTAGGYVSTLVLEGVSSINTASDLSIAGNNISIVGGFNASLLDFGGAGVNITAGEVRLQASSYGVKVDGDMSVSTLSAVSSINGISWPLTVLGDLANTYVQVDGNNVNIGGSGSGYAIQVASDNSVIVGSATANTSVVFASTIQASSDGLKMFELSGGGNLNLDTAGKISFNSGATTATDGAGLAVGVEGYTLTFPLDTAATFPVGELVNVSSINGYVYPPPADAVRQATYYNSVAQNLTSGNTDLSFDTTGAWNNDNGYITHTNGTTDFTVVQAGLYQLEANTTVLANGVSWSNSTNRVLAIDITRSPDGEHAVISQAFLTATTANYAQSASATYYLEAGDVINIRINAIYSTANVPTAMGITNTFDLGTFFTWRFIS